MSPYKNDVILKNRSKKCCHEKLLSCNMSPCKSDPAYKRVAVQKCHLVQNRPFVQESCLAKVSPRAKVTLRAIVTPCKSVPSCKRDAMQKCPFVQKCPRAKVSSCKSVSSYNSDTRAKVTRSPLY